MEYVAVEPADTSCGKVQVEHVQQKFLNFATYQRTYVLKINHSFHDYSPVITYTSNWFGYIIAHRRLEANLMFLRRLIDGLTDSPELLSLVNFKVGIYYSFMLVT